MIWICIYFLCRDVSKEHFEFSYLPRHWTLTGTHTCTQIGTHTSAYIGTHTGTYRQPHTHSLAQHIQHLPVPSTDFFMQISSQFCPSIYTLCSLPTAFPYSTLLSLPFSLCNPRLAFGLPVCINFKIHLCIYLKLRPSFCLCLPRLLFLAYFYGHWHCHWQLSLASSISPFHFHCLSVCSHCPHLIYALTLRIINFDNLTYCTTRSSLPSLVEYMSPALRLTFWLPPPCHTPFHSPLSALFFYLHSMRNTLAM